jgi:hypothetical protein
MPDLETKLDDAIATTETDVKANTITLLDKARAAYTAGWPYWTPAVALAALAGHVL